jgi:hypothetical protein
MSINKNFVVKNGLEVNTSLIVADAIRNNVGIGSTIPTTKLDVRGGIAATDIYAVGLVTFTNELNVGTGGTVLTALGSGSIGVGTITPAYLLDVRSPVSTGQTALYVQGDVRITGDLVVGDDLVFDEFTARNANITGITTTNNLNVTGIATIATLGVTGLTTTQNLTVTGITTTNSLNIGANQVISSARQLQNIASLDATTTATIESAIANGPNAFTDLKVTGISTFVGLATFNSGLQVVSGVTTLGVTTTTSLTAQSLNISGVSTFVGLATFNSGLRVVSGITTLGVTTTTSLTAQSLNVSGISTLGTVQVSSGVVTATSGIVTYYGDGSKLTGIIASSGGSIGIESGGSTVGTAITTVNFVGTGLTVSQSGNTSNVYLPPAGVSLGLAIALGG